MQNQPGHSSPRMTGFLHDFFIDGHVESLLSSLPL
jgi:hypothetical protein